MDGWCKPLRQGQVGQAMARQRLRRRQAAHHPRRIRIAQVLCAAAPPLADVARERATTLRLTALPAVQAKHSLRIQRIHLGSEAPNRQLVPFVLCACNGQPTTKRRQHRFRHVLIDVLELRNESRLKLSYPVGECFPNLVRLGGNLGLEHDLVVQLHVAILKVVDVASDLWQGEPEVGGVSACCAVVTVPGEYRPVA